MRLASKLRPEEPMMMVAEFIIIVVGVLAALAADKWMNEREDQALETQYLGRLVNDIRFHRREMEAVNAANDWGEQGSSAMLALMDRGELSSVSPAELARVALQAGISMEFNSRLAVYEELQASGRMALIEDMAVRNALIDYSRVREEFTQFWDYSRGPFTDMVNGNLHPDVSDQFFDQCIRAEAQASQDVSAYIVFEGMDDCNLQLDGYDTSRLAERLSEKQSREALLVSMRFQRSTEDVLYQFDEAAERLEQALLTAWQSDTRSP